MSQSAWKHGMRTGAWTVSVILTLVLSTGSCTKPRKTAGVAAPMSFGSPEEAESALLKAASAGDQSTLIAIFGPGSKTVLFTGDPATDKARLDDFVTAYNQMHRWSRIKAG